MSRLPNAARSAPSCSCAWRPSTGANGARAANTLGLRGPIRTGGVTGFSTWSLTKLRDHLLAEGIVAQLSRETLRRILHDGGISWQTTTTWKASTDPDFIPKMRRIVDLYDHPPGDGRVVCVDEFGPLNLLPRKGKAWRPQRRPRRQRATYTRTAGVVRARMLCQRT